MSKTNAILVRKIAGKVELTDRERVPHAFEVNSTANPCFSIHHDSTQTYKIGVRKVKKEDKLEGLFRIVQMSNGGDPDSVVSGISMSKDHQVGIGTDEGKERLHVNGNLRVEDDTILPPGFGGKREGEGAADASTTSLRNLVEVLYAELRSQRERIEELERRVAKEGGKG